MTTRSWLRCSGLLVAMVLALAASAGSAGPYDPVFSDLSPPQVVSNPPYGGPPTFSCTVSNLQDDPSIRMSLTFIASVPWSAGGNRAHPDKRLNWTRRFSSSKLQTVREGSTLRASYVPTAAQWRAIGAAVSRFTRVTWLFDVEGDSISTGASHMAGSSIALPNDGAPRFLDTLPDGADLHRDDSPPLIEWAGESSSGFDVHFNYERKLWNFVEPKAHTSGPALRVSKALWKRMWREAKPVRGVPPSVFYMVVARDRDGNYEWSQWRWFRLMPPPPS